MTETGCCTGNKLEEKTFRMDYTDGPGKCGETDKPGRKEKTEGGRKNRKVGEERIEVIAVITIKTGLFA